MQAKMYLHFAFQNYALRTRGMSQTRTLGRDIGPYIAKKAPPAGGISLGWVSPIEFSGNASIFKVFNRTTINSRKKLSRHLSEVKFAQKFKYQFKQQ